MGFSSQTKLAEFLGVSLPSVSRWENGHAPSLPNARIIADKMGIPINEIAPSTRITDQPLELEDWASQSSMPATEAELTLIREIDLDGYKPHSGAFWHYLLASLRSGLSRERALEVAKNVTALAIPLKEKR